MSETKNKCTAFQSDAEIEELFRRFDSCVVAPSEFTHAQHLAVALVYHRRDPDAGEGRHRAALLRLLKHHGLEAKVFHETLTAFWFRRVRTFADNFDDSADDNLCRVANELCKQFADTRLVFDYYSKEVIDSPEARAGWVGPDLKALDF